MFITTGFLTKVKSFLDQIEYPYTDRYYPDIVSNLIQEQLPNGDDIETIENLLKAYKYVKFREQRVLKAFNTPKHLSKYLEIPTTIQPKVSKFTDKRNDQIVITNALSNSFQFMKQYQIFTSRESNYTVIRKEKGFFTQNVNAFKIKTFLYKIELYRSEVLIAKFSFDKWGKKYRFKPSFLNDFTIEQSGDVFKFYTLNLDQEKTLLGQLQFRFLKTAYANGVVLIKVLDEQAYDWLLMFGLGMLYSMIYSENSRRSSS